LERIQTVALISIDTAPACGRNAFTLERVPTSRHPPFQVFGNEAISHRTIS
jgi:hypothetical protein